MITTKQRRARFASELIRSEDDPAPCGKESCRFGKTVIIRGVLCEQCCRWYHFSCAGTCQAVVNNLPTDEELIYQICQSRSSGLTQQMQDMMIDDNMGLSSGLTQAMKSMQLEDTLVWNYRSLPDYITTNPEELKTLNGKTLHGAKLEHTFMKTVHHKQNIFALPSGNAGKAFVAEMSRWPKMYNSTSAGATSSTFAFSLLPVLLLQKPSKNSKNRDHVNCLQQRLVKWNDTDVDGLLKESDEIQRIFCHAMKTSKQKPLDPKRFSALIHSGKYNTAISSLDTESKPLPMSDEVCSILREKHPKSELIQQGSLLYGPVDDPVLTIANDITAENIKTAALYARGSADPSGVDALNARRMICSNNFPNLRELCDGLARFRTVRAIWRLFTLRGGYSLSLSTLLLSRPFLLPVLLLSIIIQESDRWE